MVQNPDAVHEHVHDPAPVKNGPSHDHAVHQVGTKNVDFLEDHAANAQADKVGLFDAKVVHNGKNVLGHNVKVVRLEFRKYVLAQPMVPEIEQQQPEMWCKCRRLELPSADGSSRTVNENHPRRLAVVPYDLVVQHVRSVQSGSHRVQSSRIRPLVWVRGGTTCCARIRRPCALTSGRSLNDHILSRASLAASARSIMGSG